LSRPAKPVQLVFIYGPPAAGKLTVARELAELTGAALFHNHLVVDAVMAVFPFGSEPFVRLREHVWMQVFGEAAAAGRSLIFTFTPEATVAPDFPQRAKLLVEDHGGEVVFAALRIGREEQERRLVDESRAAFGKLRDVAVLRELFPQMERCMAAMPPPHISLDVERLRPDESAAAIARLMST
jgi:hypothetical protein